MVGIWVLLSFVFIKESSYFYRINWNDIVLFSILQDMNKVIAFAVSLCLLAILSSVFDSPKQNIDLQF